MTAFRWINRWLFSALGMLLTVAAGLWYFSVAPIPLPPLALSEDRLFHPDVVIHSQSLSQLPKDLLTIPLLHTLLTEEYVFYYEQNESRLTLEGTLRRIAYERNMGVGDEIIAHVLNTPAQVALWKNRDGKLKDYLLLLPKQGLVRFLELLSTLALDDSQLQKQQEVTLDNGAAYTVWALHHTPRHTLYFATLGDYLAVFTDPTLLEPGAAGERRQALGQFIPRLGPTILGTGLHLATPTAKHTIAARGAYLSFGYQYFFPALEGVRFDFDTQGWTTAILAATPFAATPTLWQRLPADPALCLALPVDPQRLMGYLGQLTDNPELARLLAQLHPAAALCWYGDSQLHTPLAVLPLEKSSADWLPLLAGLFAKTVGNQESFSSENKPVIESAPVVETPCPGGRVWRRPVSSPHGLLEVKEAAYPMRSRRYFAVTLALCHDTLLFTPDPLLADRALGVLAKNYPPLADSLAANLPPVSLTVSPRPLALLLRKSLLDSLPPSREAVFRASVEKRFLPLLDKVATLPAQALATPRHAGSWEPLVWHGF